MLRIDRLRACLRDAFLTEENLISLPAAQRFLDLAK